MNGKSMAAGCMAAAATVAAGNVLATAAIRTTGLGIMKKLPDKNGIALTFDDGPHPVYTARLLDVLKQHGVRATFFVIGEKVEAYPWLLKRMREDGHEIGIHHYKHRSAWRLTPRALRNQLELTDRAIRKASGMVPRLYRPPWGRLSPYTLTVAKDYETLIWSHIFGDWKTANCSGLAKRLKCVPADGSIVLLHDDGSNPGADEAAPASMIRELDLYLHAAVRDGIPFVTAEGSPVHEH
ncbi:polysaccharide deacetylase family protein [Bhargavaea ullalensis]|uniref:Peptidoglycan/xylan/chitin deacetylase (PgdA/CDA1 family) n=1 Tax=Bhargavaea ullalensis TaxID=1265685 RepID=A0ABV2GF57_9BACL